MSETTSSTLLPGGMRPEAARRHITSFGNRFGEAHLYLAYHAAFPMALTPDLLYRLWANFQRDIHGELLKIPWVAVADLLLSNLCDEVGHELYEMNMAVRTMLLGDMRDNPVFGSQRINDLSSFLLEYIQQQLHSDDPNIRDFAQVQQWTALAYLFPDKAAHELTLALHASLEQNDKVEQMRMASLIETFSELLADFAPLLVYAKDIMHLSDHVTKSALAQSSTGSKSDQVEQPLRILLTAGDSEKEDLPAPVPKEPPSSLDTGLSVEGKSELIPPGSHICQLYSRVTEIQGVTARLMNVGLLLSEKCMFAAAPAQVMGVVEELRKLQVDVDAVIESGQLMLHDEREIFLANGKRFDPYFLLSSHQTFMAQALREGWQAVRISIDMTWLVKDIATPEQILKYEAASDAVFNFQNAPIIALMHYDHTKLIPSLVVEMLKLHPIAVVGKYIKRNPYYLNSEQYMLKILRINRNKEKGL